MTRPFASGWGWPGPSSLPGYEVLACFKLGIILESTYARACGCQAPVETDDALNAHTLNLFNRAPRMIGKANG